MYIYKRWEAACEASFSFLNDTSFILAINECAFGESETWRLEVHRLSVALQTTAVNLELPAFARRGSGHNVIVSSMLIRSDPNDDTSASQHIFTSGRRDKAYDGRVFRPSPDERILVLSCTVALHGQHHIIGRFAIVMRAPQILSIASGKLAEGQHTVPWPTWGPEATRWMRQWSLNAFVIDVHGQRYLTSAEGPNGSSALSVMDFNPYTISRDSMCPLASPLDPWESGDEIHTRVIKETSVLALPYAFKQPITSSLPYRETLYPMLDGLDHGNSAFCFDEERLMVFRVSSIPALVE